MATQTDNSIFDLPARSSNVIYGPPLPAPPQKIVARPATKSSLDAYAATQGLILESTDDSQYEYQLSLAARLCHPKRTGQFLAPALRFTNFSLDAAQQIFKATPQDLGTPKHTCSWTADTPERVWLLAGNLQHVQPKICMGASKALKLPSEYFIRKVARYIMMKAVHVTRTTKVEGQPRSRRILYVNALYVIMDENAELHKPKDKSKIELSFTLDEETRMKEMVLEDVEAMAAAGFNLSSRWLVRLGPKFKRQAAAAAKTEAWMLKNDGRHPPRAALPASPASSSEEEEEEEEEDGDYE